MRHAVILVKTSLTQKEAVQLALHADPREIAIVPRAVSPNDFEIHVYWQGKEYYLDMPVGQAHREVGMAYSESFCNKS